MWAQNNLWAYVGIFCGWANEIKARKFVPQQSQMPILSYNCLIKLSLYSMHFFRFQRTWFYPTNQGRPPDYVYYKRNTKA